mmetsp:Transcript_4645/g.11829  ORF Transcript_4645/g.11829 Transcript_4645/m.11829 type:complete len:529 (-) Transcript_4645:3279-4865(-)
MGNSSSNQGLTAPGENADENHSTQDQQRRHPAVKYPVAACRNLSAFPTTPFIECLVGPDRIPYRYNAVIMASRSMFIDALLSSPITESRRQGGHGEEDNEGGGEKEGGGGSTKDSGRGGGGHDPQEEQQGEQQQPVMCQIDLSDIPQQTWIKMMTMLEPGGLLDEQCASIMHIRETKEIVEVLGFYEQYQFLDGIHLCDVLLASEYKRSLECREASRFVDHTAFGTQCVIGTALRFSIQFNLPQSKPSAIKLTKRLLKALIISEREDVEFLFRFLLNDGTDGDIDPIVTSVLGESRTMRAKLFAPPRGQGKGSEHTLTATTGKRKRMSEEEDGIYINFDFFWEKYKQQSEIVLAIDSKNAYKISSSPVIHVQPLGSSSQKNKSSKDGIGRYVPTKTKEGQRIHFPRLERRGAMSKVWILHPDSNDTTTQRSNSCAAYPFEDRQFTATVLVSNDFAGSSWEIAIYQWTLSDAYTFEVIIPTTTEPNNRCTKTVLYRNKQLSEATGLPPSLKWVSVRDPGRKIVANFAND